MNPETVCFELNLERLRAEALKPVVNFLLPCFLDYRVLVKKNFLILVFERVQKTEIILCRPEPV
jgi:hypothetical protein